MKIHSLQYLRGLAAMLVVLHHAQATLPGSPVVIPYFFANAGVYLFFALSGFLMVHVTDEREQSPLAFLRSRAVRIVPIYWIATLLAATIAPDLMRLALSLAFIPHENAKGIDLPVLGVGWTLNYEMFFYALFAASMAVSTRYRAFVAVGVLATLVALAVPFYGSPIILQFAFGMMLAMLPRSGSLPLWALPVAIGLSGAAMLAGDALIVRESEWQRVVAYGLPTVAVLAVALLCERRGMPYSAALEELGNASYSIYLFHMFPLALLGMLWPAGYGLPTVLINSAIAAACGYAVHRFIENPIGVLLRDRKPKAIAIQAAE